MSIESDKQPVSFDVDEFSTEKENLENLEGGQMENSSNIEIII